MKIGRGFAGRVALSGKPVIIGKAHDDLRFDPIVLEKEGLKSLSSVPIMAKDEILGVMCVGSYARRNFIERDVRLLETIANQTGMAIENAQLYENTVEISFKDELTGLYNRRYLMEQIEREFARASRRRIPLSLLMIDMDGLKGINDRFGHNEGSAFLKQLGAIIKANTRTSDVGARLGGDEFVLLSPDTDVTEAKEIGERLLAETRHYRRQIDGWDVGMSVSIGIATYPTHASDEDEIMSKADEAMYEAKRAGKNQLCLASPAANPAAGNRKKV
jgi:diguanylate cyclase (GGDEF)-like protein